MQRFGEILEAGADSRALRSSKRAVLMCQDLSEIRDLLIHQTTNRDKGLGLQPLVPTAQLCWDVQWLPCTSS